MFSKELFEVFLKDADRKQPEITASRTREVGQVIIVCSYQEEEKLWKKAGSGSHSQFPFTELYRMMIGRSL